MGTKVFGLLTTLLLFSFFCFGKQQKIFQDVGSHQVTFSVETTDVYVSPVITGINYYSVCNYQKNDISIRMWGFKLESFKYNKDLMYSHQYSKVNREYLTKN